MVILQLSSILLASAILSASGDASTIAANDNLRPAGTLAGGVLTLHLRAGAGTWRPEGPSGPALRVEAFGEEGSPLSVPAPLIRVPAGTEIHASVRNDLAYTLRVHGLCERGGVTCAPVEVTPGQSHDLRFRAGEPGTYHYWATTTGMPLQFRGAGDSQLSGAFVVDPPGGTTERDRVFVITEWTSLTREQLRELAAQIDPGAAFIKLRPDVLFAMNGRVWPHTERLTYALGETVRWRVINLSTQVHPMHMHGFYFDVDSVGDGVRDKTFAPNQKQRVVTHVMQPGAVMRVTWTPERVGNWLFHCHVLLHVSPVLHVDGSRKVRAANPHDAHGASAGMTGMVMGVTVTGPEPAWDAQPPDAGTVARKMTLLMRSEPRRYGDAPAYGFDVADSATGKASARLPVPGPTLVLARGEPVEITLVNRLPEGTSIHWHGMELESYYDGVHGWSGTPQRVTPMIEPGESFVVKFTPPRTGTFMYHTHLHDGVHLSSGLYGAMLVLDSPATYDEASDHVLILGRGGPTPDAPVIINGERALQVAWRAGSRHRLRLINITPDDVLAVTLQGSDGPVMWRPLTKDGMPYPGDPRDPVMAKQLIAVGETYDFEVDVPPGRRTLWLEVRSPGGKWQSQGQVVVR